MDLPINYWACTLVSFHWIAMAVLGLVLTGVVVFWKSSPQTRRTIAVVALLAWIVVALLYPVFQICLP